MIRPRFFLFVIISVILVGLLIFFNARAPGQLLRAQMYRIIRPLAVSLNIIRRWGSGVLLQANDGGQNNFEREGRLAVLTAEVDALTEENNRLRSAIGFKNKNNINLKGVSVVYYGREFGKEYLLIDRGVNEGIKKGDSVVDANGLMIGKVIDAEMLFAKVSIAANVDEVFDAELLPLAVNAFAKGLGGRAFSLELIAQNAVIRKGDYIMAKSNQFSFLLGEVVRVETSSTGAFKEVRGILLSHPDLEDEVFVVLNE